MKKFIIILTGTILILATVVVVGFNYYQTKIGKEITESMIYRNSLDQYDDAYWQEYKQKYNYHPEEILKNREGISITISNDSNYNIPGTYFFHEGNIEKTTDANTAILIHGQSADKTSMYDTAELFLKNGINVLAIDQRNSGESTFPYITFGWLEKSDLETVVSYVKQQAPTKKIIAAGQSMGAATVALYSGTEHAANFLDYAIIDSSYDSMKSMLVFGMKEIGVDVDNKDTLDFSINAMNNYMKKEYGFVLEDVDIVNSVQTNKVPTLVIQGTEDTLTLPYMGKSIYETIPHQNKIYWEIPYGHTEGIKMLPQEYEQKIRELLNIVR